MKEFDNKVALVTGSSRGIGAAIAIELAKKGANIVLTYSSSKEKAELLLNKIKAMGSDVMLLKMDAKNPSSMSKLIDSVSEKFGGIDILVNNAGVFNAFGLIGDIDESEFEFQLSVNVRSVFSLTQAAVKKMKPGGRIINISSMVGERAAFPGCSAYIMTKFAISGLTRAWALDLSSKDITVNAVLPGPIATDMTAGLQGADQTPALKRLGTPEEIANVVVFLASSASTFMTGALVTVDGGANA
ncbi:MULTISPECIES: 3-oxoacyl-ACP reductase family protein [Enterobacter]|uniref:SDR family NAD(P)-dependent oxidoreductase n=1 Tax=Enterobacter TaxID=547 RepID=UPI0010CA4561|nr:MULTISPECIES: 3-oxoacyl-ACP reductase family protein [Enterobacter]UAN18770.1 3-oxoacyl-ACP reductase FabG [Enterobacter asburiae]UAN24655.1 3-oxoacyl-ACP reductase FabG [Enterobacter sp. JBIWA003]UAN34201.1 3-oxoacyl-ACP reductase FabG [Enterobacter sp. JBIWA005]BBJ69921.1 3-ketoacyl-ACP reductase [Enterobacter sp. 18A13]